MDGGEEASRLISKAGGKLKESKFKSALKHVKKAQRLAPNMEGVSSMLLALKILKVASKSSSDSTKDWYEILQVEPFSHINTIKKEYKKLALLLHPDKNPHLGCEDAFKLVGEGFRVLSDKIRRKEYDMRLRLKMQEEAVKGLDDQGRQTFWTACSRCRLLHQFERRYLGHNLVCPSCNKSFLAVEVDGGGGDDGGDSEEDDVGERLCDFILKKRAGSLNLKRKVGSGGVSVGANGEIGDSENVVGGDDESGQSRVRRRKSAVGEVLARSMEKKVVDPEALERVGTKKTEVDDESMTLAEMQLLAKRKANQQKLKLKEKRREEAGGGKENEMEVEECVEVEQRLVMEKSEDLANGEQDAEKCRNLEIVSHEGNDKSDNSLTNGHDLSESDSLEIMDVEDSDFYDFDKDRVERSFKNGQIWAIYDDDDGMPRHYCLIDEVVSVNPFEVKISWLDLENNVDEELVCWENLGYHVSCGRFKISKKTSINSLNIFSHIMDCERAAREVYRIYPKKGSVWALYSEIPREGRNHSAKGRRSYNIVVFLTTYSEIHGLSMGYLEKVDGFKTIFKRREIGCHAVKWLEKDDIRLFSHQIPARELSGDDVPDHLKNCWELDPASLPADLLIGWKK